MRAVSIVLFSLFGSSACAAPLEIKGINWTMPVRQILQIIRSDYGLSCSRENPLHNSTKSFSCRGGRKEIRVVDDPIRDTGAVYFNCYALGSCHMDSDVFAQLVARQLPVRNLRAAYLRDHADGVDYFAYVGASKHEDYVVVRGTDLALHRGTLMDAEPYLRR